MGSQLRTGELSKMDKFKLGQPVWSISVRDGKWRPGVVTGPNIMRRYFSYEVHEFVNECAYHVHLPDAMPTPGFRDDRMYCKREEHLRPRDEGQFTPADETFEWRQREAAT